MTESLKAEQGFDVYKCIKNDEGFCMHKLFWPNGPPAGGYPNFVERRKATGEGFKSLQIDWGDQPNSLLKTPDKTELPENDAPGCENPLSNVNPTSLSAGEAANAEAIGRALGMSAQCVQQATEHMEVALRDKNRTFSLLNLLGTAYDKTTTDNYMTSVGCGEFYSTLQNTFSSMARLRCQFTNIKNNSETKTTNNNSVRISVLGPNPVAADAIKRITKRYQRDIANFTKNEMPSDALRAEWYRENPEMYDRLMEYYEIRLKGLEDTFKYYTDQHPLTGDIVNSKIQINQKMRTGVTIMDEIRPEESANIKTEMENLATEASIVKIEEEISLGALPPNAREFIQANAKQLSEEHAVQNMSIINQNKMTVTNNGDVRLEVYGSMLGSTLIISTDSEIDVKLQSTLASAITLSEQVSTRIVADIKAERHIIYQSEGITDLWSKIASGATERYKISTISDTIYWIVVAVVVAVFAYFLIQSQFWKQM